MFWFQLTRPQTTLLLFVDCTILTLQSRNLTVPRLTKRFLLMRRLSLIAIQMICLRSLLSMLRNAKTNFLRCIGYLSFTKDRIKLDPLPTLALALQQNCLNYKLLASLLSNLVAFDMRHECMKGQRKVCFGL